MENIKYKIVRIFLKLMTFWFPVKFGEIENNHDKILIIPRLPEDGYLKTGLVKAYQQIFSEPPWQEKWSEEKILEKIERELTGNSFLVMLKGNQDFPVAGFCWGRIMRISELEKHIKSALGESPVGLEENLLKKTRKDERILYFHEFAVLRRFRKGLEQIRYLLRPSLEYGWLQGVHKTLFWSTPESKIVPLSLYMGYEPIYKTNILKKQIIFLFNPAFSPLLKINQRIKGRTVAKAMGFIARLL